MMMERACRTCEFWAADHEVGRKGQGQCRVNPPLAEGMMGHWPITYEAEWCGQWHEREDIQKKPQRDLLYARPSVP